MNDLVAVVRRSEARIFRLVAIAPYTRIDGSETEIAVWEGTCAKCGAPFTITTPRPGPLGRIVSKNFQRVSCDRHKRQPKGGGMKSLERSAAGPDSALFSQRRELERGGYEEGGSMAKTLLNEVALFRAVEHARLLSRDFPIADACRWAAQEFGAHSVVIERLTVQAEVDCARAAAALARAKLRGMGGRDLPLNERDDDAGE